MIRTTFALLGIHILMAGVWAQGGEADPFEEHKEEPTPYVKGNWTIVVLPDTQNYLSKGGNYRALASMADWIVEEKGKRNIKIVVSVGDMTDQDSDSEWKQIREIYKTFDNVLPYVVCEGNHDRKHGGLMHNYFKIDQNPLNEEIFGGCMEEGKLQSAWYEMKINGIDYLFLSLGENPGKRKQVVKWGVEVVKNHPDHRVFIANHGHLNERARISGDRETYDHRQNQFFKTFVTPFANVEFVTSGHYGGMEKGEGVPRKYKGIRFCGEIGSAHESDKVGEGITCHQIFFNAQFVKNKRKRKDGGAGWLQMLEFSKDNKEVRVKTYSSWRKVWRTGSEYEYTLKRD